jgi:hypothetical protein
VERWWTGAEGPRRAADGGRPSSEPGRWRGRAAPLGYTPAWPLSHRELVVSGLTTGLMGYAVGTYLGLAVSWVLRP